MVDELTPSERLMASAWESAAADLGVRLTVAGEIRAEGGKVLTYVVFVEDFGSSAGTVCRGVDAPDAGSGLSAWAKKAGVFRSNLADVYRVYDRDLFAETLDDWGWFGSGEPPSWYGGPDATS